MIIMLVWFKHRHSRNDGEKGLLHDYDDERATVMVYSTEGGGEEDQVNI